MFDWITGFIESTGYVGIALLMLAENIFPPIPSELVMPLAGFTAAQGELNIGLVILAGTAGSLLGALAWYYVGRWVGAKALKRWASHYGRWLTMAPEDIDKSMSWFRRHGRWAVLGGRLIPAIRTLISVPAGMARMSLAAFLFYTTIGSALWTAFLAIMGYLFEEKYDQVAAYMNPVTNSTIALLVLYYFYRVITYRRSGF